MSTIENNKRILSEEELDRLDDIELAKLVEQRHNEPEIKVNLKDL